MRRQAEIESGKWCGETGACSSASRLQVHGLVLSLALPLLASQFCRVCELIAGCKRVQSRAQALRLSSLGLKQVANLMC